MHLLEMAWLRYTWLGLGWFRCSQLGCIIIIIISDAIVLRNRLKLCCGIVVCVCVALYEIVHQWLLNMNEKPFVELLLRRWVCLRPRCQCQLSNNNALTQAVSPRTNWEDGKRLIL